MSEKTIAENEGRVKHYQSRPFQPKISYNFNMFALDNLNLFSEIIYDNIIKLIMSERNIEDGENEKEDNNYGGHELYKVLKDGLKIHVLTDEFSKTKQDIELTLVLKIENNPKTKHELIIDGSDF